MKLIDKDALVAWAKETYLCENASMIRKVCYKQLVEHLNTLEVKEVNLDREMQAFALLYLEPLKISDSNIGISITMAQLYSCAKHFFELGLKAQKS